MANEGGITDAKKKRRVLEVSEENAELCGFILQRLIMTAMMEDPWSPEFRETRIKVPSRSDVIGRPVNCGGRGWMWGGRGRLFPWRPKN